MKHNDKRILIFGGTTEGRLLAEFCREKGIPAFVSVATDYGGALLAQSDCIEVITGRKDADAIGAFLAEHSVTLVIDATHPFAVEASKNIACACDASCVKVIRVLRGGSSDGYGFYFDSIPSVVQYLNAHGDGNVFITTGSKELPLYGGIVGFSERCAVRVLPVGDVVERCVSLGFRRERIVAEKGPFSAEQNAAHIRQFHAAFVVTKESGSAGGFEAKQQAARQCGALLLIIRRPAEKGVSLEEAEKILQEESRINESTSQNNRYRHGREENADV